MMKAPPNQESCLVMIHGRELGKKFELNRPVMIIGRSSLCEIQLVYDRVSRQHTKLLVGSDSVSLRDLDSTNGTFVNDLPVFETTLRDGDLIQVGHTIFKFLSGENVEKSYHEEIYRLTNIDGLTGVYNQRYLMEHLSRELARSQRYERHLSLILCDISNFDQIKRLHGLQSADLVLKHLARKMKASFRREDSIARSGDREFIVILPETDSRMVKFLARKLQHLVETSPFISQDGNSAFRELHAQVVIGMATSDHAITDPADLIQLARRDLRRTRRNLSHEPEQTPEEKSLQPTA